MLHSYIQLVLLPVCCAEERVRCRLLWLTDLRLRAHRGEGRSRRLSSGGDLLLSGCSLDCGRLVERGHGRVLGRLRGETERVARVARRFDFGHEFHSCNVFLYFPRNDRVDFFIGVSSYSIIMNSLISRNLVISFNYSD